jgi:predicted ribosomally synthesized peptide with SipW-like signal peptide
MKRAREVLMLLLLLGLGLAGGGIGTFASWAASTQNDGNQLATGTVDLTDSDGGSTVFNITNVSPSAPPAPRCVVVTNSGSLAVQVALYASVSGQLKDYLSMKVSRGAVGGTCASPGATTVLFDSTLTTFPTTSGSAIVDPATWAAGQSRPFIFEFTVANDENAQGKSVSIGMTWEGRA